MKQRIVFVDDEPNLLAALKRILKPMSSEWDMEFALGGKTALQEIERQCFDVVVTDMKMPDIDGSRILEEVRKACPLSVRLVLSGQADEAAIIRALKYSHQYISKPCDRLGLQRRVARACAARDLVNNEKMKALVSSLDTVYALPGNLDKIKALISVDCPNIDEIARVVVSDVGISAKILQLTNSDYFGKGKPLLDIQVAVQRLGVKALDMLINRSDIFKAGEINSMALSPLTLTQHSLSVAQTSKLIAKHEGLSEELQAEAYTAGLLHEIGRFILVNELPKEYEQVLDLIKNQGLSHHQAEKQIFGANHSEIGAYLLALWGLSESVVEAVAYQGKPQDSAHKDFRVLSVLHAANALEDELRPVSLNETQVQLDRHYLEQIKKTDKVNSWRQKTRARE